MARNSNEAIKRAHGELIKILYMDDWLYDEDTLQKIVEEFTDDTNWLITAANNNLNPHYNKDIHLGVNTLGSPSALTIRNGLDVYFDENLTWLLDCLLYKQLFDRFGEPKIMKDIGVGIGIHEGQMTNLIPKERKQWELEYIREKYYIN